MLLIVYKFLLTFGWVIFFGSLIGLTWCVLASIIYIKKILLTPENFDQFLDS